MSLDDADGRKRSLSLAERFWGKVSIGSEDECWPWLASCSVTRQGFRYGNIKIAGRAVRSHRVAWELTHGPIPDGLFVCHHCDNPICVNPAHLFLGDATANMRDMAAKGRGDGPTGVEQWKAKLTPDAVRQIRALYGAGASQYSIAKQFGISQLHVSRIVRRVSWKVVA